MKTTNVTRLLENVVSIVDQNGQSDGVKLLLGDSIFNNRVLSVNQVLRFLDEFGYWDTYAQLNALYTRVRSEVRGPFVYRSDAIDFNELSEYLDTRANHRSLSQVLKNAA